MQATSARFRTATIEGQISGMTLNVGIVDDPVKDRQAANSKTTRDSTWDWFTDLPPIRCSGPGSVVDLM